MCRLGKSDKWVQLPLVAPLLLTIGQHPFLNKKRAETRPVGVVKVHSESNFMKKYRERQRASYPEAANQRVHDFIKGWGTYSKTGKSILWDGYRPAKRRRIKWNKTISWPISFKNKEAAANIALALKTPILQVMESCPILTDIFKTKTL